MSEMIWILLFANKEHPNQCWTSCLGINIFVGGPLTKQKKQNYKTDEKRYKKIALALTFLMEGL